MERKLARQMVEEGAVLVTYPHSAETPDLR